MAFSTCTMVAALIPNILDGASTLDNLGAKIRPASSEIRQFMSGGCSLIVAKVNSMGFSPPGAGGILYDFLSDIEANYAAWRSEMSRSSPRTAKGERSRADTFRKAYEAGLRQLAKMDLGLLGWARVGSIASKWGTGVSIADKEAIAGDTDRVEPAFTRGGFANPDADADDDQT